MLLKAQADGMVARANVRFGSQAGPVAQALAALEPATRRAETGTKTLTESGDVRLRLLGRPLALPAWSAWRSPARRSTK